jgi:putative lipoic acid-binding regulatory protein
LDLLPDSDYSKRESKNRKYTSVTISKIMKNADEILYIYEKASKIDDIISL